MGIAANQARLMTLTARQSDLELQAQKISATKMRISQESEQWAMTYSKALNSASLLKTLDPDKCYEYDSASNMFKEVANGTKGSSWKSDASGNISSNGQYNAGELISQAEGNYNSQMAALSSQEKRYDMQLTQINTEHDAVKTEYDAIKSLVGDNTEKSFNVFG